MRDLTREDVSTDTAAQEHLVRGLWRRGDRETLRDLIWLGRVEAVWRASRDNLQASRDPLAVVAHARRGDVVVSLACGALEVVLLWERAQQRDWCAAAALRVVPLIADPDRREHWRETLEWWRDPAQPHTPPRGRLPADGGPQLAIGGADGRARSACVYALDNSPYSPERTSRAALEAVGTAYGSDARELERRYQTRALIGAVLGAACD